MPVSFFSLCIKFVCVDNDVTFFVIHSDALDMLISLTQQGQSNPFHFITASSVKNDDSLITVKRTNRIEKAATVSIKKPILPDPLPGIRRRGRPLGSKNAPRTVDQNGNYKPKTKLSSADARIIHVSTTESNNSSFFEENNNSYQSNNNNSARHCEEQHHVVKRHASEKNNVEKNNSVVEKKNLISLAEQSLAYNVMCNLIEQEFVSNSAICFTSCEESKYNLSLMQSTLQRIALQLQHFFDLQSLAAWISHVNQNKTIAKCISTANVIVQLLCGPVDRIDIEETIVSIDRKNDNSSSGNSYICVDWSRLTVDQMLHNCNNTFALLSRLDPFYDGNASTVPLEIVAMRTWQPNCWRLLISQIESEKMSSETLSHLSQICESKMLSFVEHAVSGVLFAPQTIHVAMQCCCEKIRMFERPLIDYIAESSSSDTFCLFWHSQSAIEFQRRISIVIALKKAAQTDDALKAFRLAMPRISSVRALPPMHLIDLLAELVGRNMLFDVFAPKVDHDWHVWCSEAHRINKEADFETLASTCTFDSTMDWLLANIGSTATQLEMQSGNVGALQNRLQKCLDEDQEPIHEQFLQHGFAVDDTQPQHRVPLPILVCYERSQPSTLDLEKDYSSVLLPSRNIFRAYGVFLYTRAPDANQSRFALMMWLSPPYAGEVVAAFTPFCQGLIDYYISCSDRTAASGYVGLKYYSASQRQFVPIDNILSRKSIVTNTVGGVYNRIPNTLALELRKSATLRESKTALLALARPPPSAKTRDSHYLAYEIEYEKGSSGGSSGEKDGEKGVPQFVNYVHPAAAHRLWMLGYEAAKNGTKPIDSNAAIQAEREKSKIMLATWQQNFFESEVAAAAIVPNKKEKKKSAEEKHSSSTCSSSVRKNNIDVLATTSKCDSDEKVAKRQRKK